MAQKLLATTAGSLPKPQWLAEPEKLWPKWNLHEDALWEGQKKAAKTWIKRQEQAGLDIVSDGEQFRIHFVHGFLQNILGINWDKKTPMGIRNNRYTVEVPTVVESVQRPGSIHAREAEFLRNNTKKKIKFTLPGPMTICDTIANDYYGTRSQMAYAFASILNEEAKELEKIGVDVIQFDEPAFNSFTKETLEWGIHALEKAVEGLACTTAVHICYGYGIRENINWKKSLGENWNQYQNIFPVLNKSSLNQVSLEFAGSKVPPELMRLLPDKELMVGVITVVANKLETPEEVKKNILLSLKYVDYERLIPCSNCGMAPLPEKIVLEKIKALGKGTALASK